MTLSHSRIDEEKAEKKKLVFKNLYFSLSHSLALSFDGCRAKAPRHASRAAFLRFRLESRRKQQGRSRGFDFSDDGRRRRRTGACLELFLFLLRARARFVVVRQVREGRERDAPFHSNCELRKNEQLSRVATAEKNSNRSDEFCLNLSTLDPPYRHDHQKKLHRIHGPVSTAPADWVPCSPKSPASGLLLLESPSCSSSSSSSPSSSSSAVRLSEVLYHKGDSGSIAKITIDRPSSRNAFTPRTIAELSCCFSDARDDPKVGLVILTGSGDEAFCSGGDQRVRSDEGGYKGSDGIPRLSVLDLQVQIRRLPKPVIALVKGYAVGGGHVLQVW